MTMFSHTKNLDEQALKLSNNTVNQPLEPQSAGPQPVETEPHGVQSSGQPVETEPHGVQSAELHQVEQSVESLPQHPVETEQTEVGEMTSPVPSPEPNPEPTPDAIAEAERRGFQRAMAMRAEELFNRATSSEPTFPPPNPEESAASEIVFLSNRRRSIWD